MLAIKNMTTNTWVRQLSILQGWTISTTIDGTYDYAVVKYISTTSKGYAPLTPAFLSQVFYITTSIEALPAIDKSYKFFLVMSDTSQTQKRLGGNEYIHTLTLIEPTKYLERIICSADAFTYRAIGTLYAQATKALINAEVLVARTAPRFSFGAETVTALSSRPSEEYYFSKPNTLKEQLDVFFKEINSRPYVPKLTNFADIIISHYDLSKILNEVSIASNVVNKSEDLKIENFTDRVVSFGENALDSRANTVIQGFETFKPNKLETLDTNNAIIQLQMPIEELIKFELNTEVTLKNRATNVFWKDIRASIDLTEYFYEEEIYRLLTVDQQKKAFFYTRGSNTIGDINRTYKSFLGIVTSAVLGAVLDDYLLYYDYVNNPSDIPKHPDYAFSLLKISRKLMGKALITDSPFKIEYVPYIDFHMDVSKNIKQEYTTALFDNQSESIVDVYAYGNNLQQKVNKIGNAEKFLDTIITNLTELKNLGDFTAEKEVITSITSSVYDRFVKVRYSLTKDYANLYQDIALDRKKTLYNIPLESVTSDILVKNIVNVSTEALTPTTFVGLNTNGLRQLIATLTNNYRLEDLRVKGILTEVKNAGINPDYDSYYYYLNTANYAGGNSLYFRMSFLDNYNAGVSIESMTAGGTTVVGGKKVIVNPYCNADGRFDDLKLILASDIFKVNSIAEYKILPKVTKANVENLDKLSAEVSLVRYKDPAVKIAITYQVELMPTADIMIGRHFIEKNLLAFKDAVGANMKIYFGATPQDINDPFKVSSYLFAIDTATTTISNGVLTIGNTPPGGYIAIGDNNRNLYLAINKEGYKKVYFTASHKVL